MAHARQQRYFSSEKVRAQFRKINPLNTVQFRLESDQLSEFVFL